VDTARHLRMGDYTTVSYQNISFVLTTWLAVHHSWLAAQYCGQKMDRTDCSQ